MRISGRSIALGLTVGVLAGGGGGALAATTAGSSTSRTSTTTTWADGGAWGGYGNEPGWSGRGPGWSGYGSGWSGYASGWSGSGRHSIDNRYGGVGPIPFITSAIKAAAGYLELTTSGLKSRLRSGRTLADLASSQHRSVSGLESTVVAAITRSVRSDSGLSAGQKAAIIAAAKGRVGEIVHDTWSGASGHLELW